VAKGTEQLLDCVLSVMVITPAAADAAGDESTAAWLLAADHKCLRRCWQLLQLRPDAHWSKFHRSVRICQCPTKLIKPLFQCWENHCHAPETVAAAYKHMCILWRQNNVCQSPSLQWKDFRYPAGDVSTVTRNRCCGMQAYTLVAKQCLPKSLAPVEGFLVSTITTKISRKNCATLWAFFPFNIE